jgi:hypothetical protein
MPILLWVVFPFALWSACMDCTGLGCNEKGVSEFGAVKVGQDKPTEF